MRVFPTFSTIEEAWIGVLAAAAKERDGRILHAVVAISEPGPPDPKVVALNDAMIDTRQGHSVDTVANTLFPGSMYDAPDCDYVPGMASADVEQLDNAASQLYEAYRTMLPVLCEFPGNNLGTYFGRLISWPGRSSDGYNQLACRVTQLRKQRNVNNSAANAADLVLEGNAELDSLEVDGLGLQIYKSTDERPRGFPCLVHLDISVVDYRLNLMAVYRHWHLINKALGNLIGLTRLLHFIAQQTGYEPGELMIHGTVANAQFDDFNKGPVREFVAAATAHSDDLEEVS